MIISGLKFRLADRTFLRKDSRDSTSNNTGKIKSIAVILDSRDPVVLKIFSEFGRKFRLEERDFVIITCAVPDENESGYLNFSDTDISWTGKIKNPEIRKFLDRNFDILIAFSNHAESTFEFLIRNSRAGLKVGRAESSEGVYDLEIFSRYPEVDIYIKEVEKYLEILKYK